MSSRGAAVRMLGVCWACLSCLCFGVLPVIAGLSQGEAILGALNDLNLIELISLRVFGLWWGRFG